MSSQIVLERNEEMWSMEEMSLVSSQASRFATIKPEGHNTFRSSAFTYKEQFFDIDVACTNPKVTEVRYSALCSQINTSQDCCY